VFEVHHLNVNDVAGSLAATGHAIKCIVKETETSVRMDAGFGSTEHSGIYDYNSVHSTTDDIVYKTEYLLFDSPTEAHAYMMIISSPEFNWAY
jgi:hypothetical protein